MLLTQTLLIFVVATIGYCNSALSSGLINRPLVLCALVGAVLGDIETGIKVGATLELMWLGVMVIGASNPADMTSGSVIGCAYVITSGSDIASAVALAVPVSMLMQMVWNFLMSVPGPIMSQKADAYALECNARGIDLMHYGFVALQVVILAGMCAVGFYAGSNVIQSVVDAVPAFVTDGLNYAMGIIPAIGFAMLARMIIDKKTACFLFLGFLLVAYGGMNLVGVAAVGVVIAAILVLNTGSGKVVAAGATGSEGVQLEVDDDDNEF